jgi:hypothetical protein
VRKLIGFAVVLLVVPLVVGGLYVGGIHLTHRRDEAGYLKYLVENANLDTGAPPVALPASVALVAEGQRACDWLNNRPHALWRSGQQYGPQLLLNRYVDEAIARTAPWPGPPDEPLVADAAWKYLCPASVELRRPLPGFRNRGD